MLAKLQSKPIADIIFCSMSRGSLQHHQRHVWTLLVEPFPISPSSRMAIKMQSTGFRIHAESSTRCCNTHGRLLPCCTVCCPCEKHVRASAVLCQVNNVHCYPRYRYAEQSNTYGPDTMYQFDESGDEGRLWAVDNTCALCGQVAWFHLCQSFLSSTSHPRRSGSMAIMEYRSREIKRI